MLKALELENFKAFGDRTRIEFAPITLIYGQNSAGKSTILQALNLLKQTHESRESGASLLPRAQDGIVDLGSFRELLHNHDTDRVTRIAVECSPSGRQRVMPPRRKSGPREMPDRFGIEFSFAFSKRTQEVILKDFSLSEGAIGQPLARFMEKELSEREAREFLRMSWSPARSRRTSRRHKVRGARCTWVTDDKDIWTPIYKAWLNNRDKICDELKVFGKELPARWPGSRPDGVDDEGDAQIWAAAVDDAIRFYQQEFELSDFIKRMTQGWLGSMVGMDGFMPMIWRRLSRPSLPELDAFEYRYGPRRGGGSELPPVLDIAETGLLAGRLLEDTLFALFPMGPFRRPPERWYIFTGTKPENVGYKGDNLPDLLFRRPELVENANKWLSRLDIGYRLKVKPIGERHSDLFEVRLSDMRQDSEVEVGLTDVGFGISQILPFVVQSLASTEQIISIEQPEVHIHPRLQADLGELLAECIRGPFRHQYLIETHSEHLVLRLQRLIREKRLQPNDLAVIYVERGGTGSRVKQLELDEQGEFVSDWPGGFFPERLRELM